MSIYLPLPLYGLDPHIIERHARVVELLIPRQVHDGPPELSDPDIDLAIRL
jgi:hypothetical protein